MYSKIATARYLDNVTLVVKQVILRKAAGLVLPNLSGLDRVATTVEEQATIQGTVKGPNLRVVEDSLDRRTSQGTRDKSRQMLCLRHRPKVKLYQKKTHKISLPHQVQIQRIILVEFARYE